MGNFQAKLGDLARREKHPTATISSWWQVNAEAGNGLLSSIHKKKTLANVDRVPHGKMVAMISIKYRNRYIENIRKF